MIKIVNKKKYQNLIDELIDVKLDLMQAKNDEKTYIEQINLINSSYEELNTKMKKTNAILESKNKEIRKLRYLLTKNNIEYKSDKSKDKNKIKNETKKVKKGE